MNNVYLGLALLFAVKLTNDHVALHKLKYPGRDTLGMPCEIKVPKRTRTERDAKRVTSEDSVGFRSIRVLLT